ncbi:kelch domain-containing protein 7B [Elephas maximus indicus]|uniref:kelch domain-containing protein 7B n=1 Tax=Elephas maximus indicus TaxID=99487 RepID=UPI002116C80F|nr:kelch domain-containing protein 7B [Elephas maximus indicus]
MTQGASEPDAHRWGWDMDGDEDWDNVVLTLLALAVVAATALALHWFGSGQDQEMMGPESATSHPQPPQARGSGSALHPKIKVSGGVEGPQQGKSGPPGCYQGSPVATEAQGQELSGREGLGATVGPTPQMPGKVVSSTARGQKHGNNTSEATQGTERQPLRPGTAPLGRSKAGGTASSILIHFTPRDPGREAEEGAGAICPKEPAHQTPGHAAEQDTSAWQPKMGLPHPRGRGWGSRRQPADTCSRDRPCRLPRLDPLRLGAVVSVWDAVDATVATAAVDTPACRLLAVSQPSPSPQGSVPQERPVSHNMQAGPLADVSEKDHRKSSPQPVQILALGSGAMTSGNGDTPGGPGSAPEEGWPWARREVLITRSFSQGPGSMDPSSPGGPRGGCPHSSQGWETPEACNMAKTGVGGSRDAHSFLSPGLGRTEKQGGHSLGEGRGSWQVEGEQSCGQATGSQAADPEPRQLLDREKPTPGLSRSIPSCSPSPSPLATPPTGAPSEQPPSTSLPAAHPLGGCPHVASTLPTSSPSSEVAPSEVSQGPFENEHFRAAPPPTLVPAPAPTSTPPPTPALTTTLAPTPAPTSTPPPTPALTTTLALTPAPTSTSPPTPAVTTLAPTRAPTSTRPPTPAMTTTLAPTPAPTSTPPPTPAMTTTLAPTPAPTSTPPPTPAMTTTLAPTPAPTSTPPPTPALTTTLAPTPAPTSTPPPTPALTTTLAPTPAPTSTPAPITTPAPIPTPALTPTLAPAPAPAPTPALTPTPAPTLTPVPVPILVPTPIPAPTPTSSVQTPASQEPRMALSRDCLEEQVSGSWGNLVAMVLKSHPFPRQERPQEGASRADPNDLADSRNSVSGPSEGSVSSVGEKGRPPVGQAAGAVIRHLAEDPFQLQPRGSQIDRAPAPGRTLSPGGTGVEEKSHGSTLPCATDPRPTPRTRKHSLSEVTESSGLAIRPAAPGQRQEAVQGQEAGPAGRGGTLKEKQEEARKLMVFLQRPGGWGVAEVPRKPSTQPPALPAMVAALRRRLDLGSCLEVLAFAQQHGAHGLAQDTYAVMSDNLLHVLGDPHLYRQLSGADRERILSLRTGRGQAVLGVLMLPSLYQLTRPGLSGAPKGEEAPTAGSVPLPPAHLHVFNLQENTWRPLTQVPAEAPLRGCGLCTMHNYLFLAGGIRGSGAKAICSNEVFCYNPLTDIWTQVQPMRQARAQLKLVALDGLLYAIGGECLYSMERYDPRTDSWTSRAPLPAGTFPVAHEAVACRGDIYVTGGHLFYRLLRYSPAKDAWDECPYSASHRRCSDIVAQGGFLYRFDLLRGVGAAVMRYNTVTGSWSRAASLPLPDPVPLRCTVLGNTIYCLNHQVTATFTVSDATAQFQAQELQPCPVGSKGVLCPFVLTLPPAAPLQTAL